MEWIKFCTPIPQPTRDLLDALWNVDLVTSHLISGDGKSWEDFYKVLVPWVRKYVPLPCHFYYFFMFQTMLMFPASQLPDPNDGENDDSSEIGDHPSASRNSRPDVNGHPSYDDGQRSADAVGRKIGDLDLVEGLLHKFQSGPQCFHLKWSPGASPPDEVVSWIVNRATGCRRPTRLDGSRLSAIDDVRLIECHCDLYGGNESQDPWHLVYQEACWRLVKAYISLFEELSQNHAEDEDSINELKNIFMNLTQSRLLKDCQLDMELITLCRTFFELAERCLRMSSHGEENKENMLEWFKVSFSNPYRCDFVSGY